MELVNYPVFKKGRILKIEMLEELRDYPRNMFEFYMKDYSEGIITGFEVEIKGNELIILPGILKLKGQLLCLRKAEKINYENTNKDMYIKLRVENDKVEKVGQEDYKKIKSKIIIEEIKELQENEIELGRYKLREGAYLRNNYEKLEDYSVEYNTLNIVNVKYATNKNYSLKKEIFDKFGEVLFKKGEKVLDISFGMIILNSDRVNREVVKKYLERKLEIEIEKMSNEEIYNNLLRISRNLGREITEKRFEKRRPMKIIVD